MPIRRPFRQSLRRACAVLLIGSALASCKPLASEPSQPWSAFANETIKDWLAIDPAFAVYEGAHKYDGKLPDWSDAGLRKKADFLQGVIDRAKAYDKLAGNDKFERDYMIKVAEGQLFWLEEADQPHTNPAFYVGGGLDPNVYLTREYAGKPARMKALIAFFNNVPNAAAQIKANLKAPMPASFLKYGIAGFDGFATAYKTNALQAFADVKDAELQKQLTEAAGKASAAMADVATWLKGQQPGGSFSLGADRFAHMLLATEAVDTPVDELEKIGRADLRRNQDALRAACDQFAPGATIPACMTKMNADKPANNDSVAEATNQIPTLTAFVREKNLVSIPGTEKALVRESPPYNRQNGAYIDPPGPYEKGIPSIYYISPPDPSWPREKQLAYISGKDDLLFTSVHEVMPGHFLQFLHANRSPSMFGRLFVGYAFAEGWAHYTEEMMWEAGLGNGDPEVHIGQLSNALLRDCRFLSAIGMHARGMTMDQSKQMFMTECFQDEGTADQQAARGTYDPAYLNYTMGKLMIRKLRADWTASRGGQKAWKDFHDAFLNYGGPPIPLVRAAMMGEAEPKAAF